ILNVIALLQSAQGGYEYPKPSIPFELPNVALQDTGVEILKENNIDKSTVSYSLPHSDYPYLQQHENEEIIQGGQNAKEVAVSQSSSIAEYNANPQPLLSVNQLISNIKNNVPPLVNLLNSEYTQNIRENGGLEYLEQNNVIPQANFNINQAPSFTENILPQSLKNPKIELQLHEHSGDVQHIQPPENVNNVIKSIELPILNLRDISAQSNSNNLNEQILNFQDNQNIFLPNINVEPPSLHYQGTQATISEELSLLNSQLNSLSLQTLNVAAPAITKSIYYHVPPPDLNEPPALPAVLPPRKIYKIIFIKAPTYDNLYNQQLQTALNSNLAPVEENTVIYVLTKKPELPEQVVIPQPMKVSEHEVLYVQYKGGQPTENDESLRQLPLNSGSDVAIERRVINGH
ncbi:jg23543, partial [Pararge aegeria aegeria]